MFRQVKINVYYTYRVYIYILYIYLYTVYIYIYFIYIYIYIYIKAYIAPKVGVVVVGLLQTVFRCMCIIPWECASVRSFDFVELQNALHLFEQQMRQFFTRDA